MLPSHHSVRLQIRQAHSETVCELKTLTHKLLIYNYDSQQKPTRDLEAPVFGHHSSVRKVTLSFELPVYEYWTPFNAQILGSSNGIVFLAFYDKIFYIWNPTTGFFKRLPDLVSPKQILANYGVGYMPASDDYKVFVYYSEDFDTTEAVVFSMRYNAWNSIWSEDAGEPSVAVSKLKEGSGILLNQALHWTDLEGDVVSFDLAEYKFRVMAGPNFNDDYIFCKRINRIASNDEGLLSLVRHTKGVTDCVDVWVMKVYGVSGSWTKLFNLKVLLPLEVLPASSSWCNPVWVMDDYTVAAFCTRHWKRLIRSYHREEKKHDIYEIGSFWAMIRYQETLIKIDY